MPEQPELNTKEKDDVIKAIKELTKGYPENKGHFVKKIEQVGAARVYFVPFEGGDDGKWRTHYATRVNNVIKAHQKLESVFPDIEKGLSAKNLVFHNLRVISLSVVLILLSGTMCWVVISSGGKYVELLAGLIGGALGYLAGKRDV